MKKMIVLALCSVLSLPMAGNSGSAQTQPIPGGAQVQTVSGGTGGGGQSPVEIANPFVECESLEKAERLAGFSITVPETIDGYGKPVIRVIQNELAEFIYGNGETQIRIRKGDGRKEISGDYSWYAELDEISVDGQTVTVKGNDGKIYTAVWNSGEAGFSINISGGTDREGIKALIQSVR